MVRAQSLPTSLCEDAAALLEEGTAIPTKTVENQIEVPASPSAVWERVVQPDGINYEMRPWMTMKMPRRAVGLTVDTVPLGQPIGRAWLRLFGFIPFDFDHLTVVEVEVGVRFLERSTMLSMRSWEHERRLTPVPGGTRVHDRVTFQPRVPVPGLAAVLARVIDPFFRHRQRRLRRYFAIR
ncbi:SRPBCC family protein [Nocardioides sp. cx-173]|uniref:SRPBCC family protein n=1 Tax=Nocardioides sp. cx-173 TaxID=2898796 RepID=UPI001E48ABF8|nr:hypothetical protein [Nocardioides sp. cx-173]MCD4526656.1 hypothetical protein [Nocardioides sp. cx-173]UGB40748.1 hypothetical protein LQ940_15370 [Nocardioides sp. cx-173]